MPQLFLKQEHYDLLLTHFDAKDMDDLRAKLESNYKPVNQVSLKDQKLLQEIVSLKMKNRLMLIHDFKVSPDMAIKITNGDQKLESIFQNEKKNFYLSWVGTRLICNGCGHEHFVSGSKTCTKLECQCNITEVEL